MDKNNSEPILSAAIGTLILFDRSLDLDETTIESLSIEAVQEELQEIGAPPVSFEKLIDLSRARSGKRGVPVEVTYLMGEKIQQPPVDDDLIYFDE